MNITKKKAMVDSFNRNVSHIAMVDFYLRQKIVPKVKKLSCSKTKNSFHSRKTSLCICVLHDIGVTWKWSVKKRKVLVAVFDCQCR